MQASLDELSSEEQNTRLSLEYSSHSTPSVSEESGPVKASASTDGQMAAAAFKQELQVSQPCLAIVQALVAWPCYSAGV